MSLEEIAMNVKMDFSMLFLVTVAKAVIVIPSVVLIRHAIDSVVNVTVSRE